MKCSYTEVFAIASVNKTWVVLTLVMHIGRKNKINKNLVEENNTGERRLIYAPEQEKVEIATEQRRETR